jgi:hypothetical protein
MVITFLELPGADVVDSIVGAVVLNDPTPKAELMGKVADIVTSDEFFHRQVLHCMEPALLATRVEEDEVSPAQNGKSGARNRRNYQRQKRI